VQSFCPSHGVFVGAYMHGTLLQQGVSLLQFWPRRPQMMPPSPPVGRGGTQVPLGAPTSMKQISPAQQSPVAVQVLPDRTQAGPPSVVDVRQR